MTSPERFTAEKLPASEATMRLHACQQLLQTIAPEASGMLVFSRSNIYYLAGTRANGILWVPRQGEPVLMVRKAPERCRLESPLTHIVSFKSYTHMEELCAACGSPLYIQGQKDKVLGAEMCALPWSLANLLQSRLPEYRFINTSEVLHKARFVKSPYELTCLRYAGRQHAKAINESIPLALTTNMNERDIAHKTWEHFFILGHGGMLRQDRYNSDLFLGSVAAGEHAVSPAPFRESFGYVGQHPAMPYMGYAGHVWQKGHTLVLDTGFMHEGYHSHSTVTYFGGSTQDLPQDISQAYAFCVHALDCLTAELKKGAPLAKVWTKAEAIKKTAPKHITSPVEINGSSIGMSMEEWPSLRHSDAHICAENMVFSIGIRAVVNANAVIVLRSVYAVEQNACVCLTPLPRTILCIE